MQGGQAKIKTIQSMTVLLNEQRNLSPKVVNLSPRRPGSKRKALVQDLRATQGSNQYLRNKVAKVSHEINNKIKKAIDLHVDKLDEFWILVVELEKSQTSKMMDNNK